MVDWSKNNYSTRHRDRIFHPAANTFWQIWKALCKLIFEGKGEDKTRIAGEARSFASIFVVAKDRGVELLVDKWIPPPVN